MADKRQYDLLDWVASSATVETETETVTNAESLLVKPTPPMSPSGQYDLGVAASPEPLVFGSWTVLRELEPKIYESNGKVTSHRIMWCRCRCGKEKPVPLQSLKHGKSTQCSSCAGHGTRRIEVTPGDRFGEWTVISEVPIQMGRNGHPVTRQFICECSCGVRKAVKMNTLRSGHSTRCFSCARKKANSREYKRWSTRTQTDAGRLQVLATYKRVAKEKGRDFLLPVEEFNRLIEMNCDYCGAPPSNVHTLLKSGKNIYPGEAYRYNGIDRVDNDLGYVPGNCVPCCPTCNRAKRKMGVDEFRDWLARISSRQFK